MATAMAGTAMAATADAVMTQELGKKVLLGTNTRFPSPPNYLSLVMPKKPIFG